MKVLLPVNLRTLFPSRSLRNFASYITRRSIPAPGTIPSPRSAPPCTTGWAWRTTPTPCCSKFAANVASEKSPVLKVMPLVIKNIAMKAVFDTVGERKSCLCLSNLGAVELPEAMAPYVQRLDFIIGVQAAAPHDCGVVSWNGTMYINCIRSIQEPELELHFYRVLQRLGLPVKVESNRGAGVNGKGVSDMYCINCGVELADSETVCPLCGTPGVSPGYAPAAGGASLSAGPHGPSRGGEPLRRAVHPDHAGGAAHRDLHPVRLERQRGHPVVRVRRRRRGAAVHLRCCPCGSEANPVIFVPADFAAIGLYLLYINFATGGHWFLTFALPVTGTIGVLVTTVVTLLRYLSRGTCISSAGR